MLHLQLKIKTFWASKVVNQSLLIQWKICNVDKNLILGELSNQKLRESKFLKPNNKRPTKTKMQQ